MKKKKNKVKNKKKPEFKIEYYSVDLFKNFDINSLNLTNIAPNFTFLSPIVNIKNTRIGEDNKATFGIDLFLFLERLDATPNVKYNLPNDKRPKKIYVTLYKKLPEISFDVESNIKVIKEYNIEMSIKLIRRDMFDEKAINPNTEMMYWSDLHQYLILPESATFAFKKSEKDLEEEYKDEISYYEKFILEAEKYPQYVLGQFKEDEKPSEDLADKFMSVKFPNVKTIVDWN